MNAQAFVRTLAAVDLPDTFNPYADRCPVYDKPSAPTLRAKTLLSMLEAAVESEVDSLWIGRDLGYRGGRRTGLALTDEIHVDAHAARWGIAAARPTKGEAVAERTAAVVWGILRNVELAVFLWNVFPLHPHEPRNPFSNRSHTARERAVGEELLCELIALIRPRRIVAIGNDAARTARRVAGGEEVYTVRHPSYGGQTEFLAQMRSLYGL